MVMLRALGHRLPGVPSKKWYMTDVCPSTVHLSIILASRNTDCPSLLKFLNLFILTSSSLNKAYGFPRQMVKPIKHTKLFIYHKWHYPLKKSDLKNAIDTICCYIDILDVPYVELLPATHIASSVRYITKQTTYNTEDGQVFPLLTFQVHPVKFKAWGVLDSLTQFLFSEVQLGDHCTPGLPHCCPEKLQICACWYIYLV